MLKNFYICRVLSNFASDFNLSTNFDANIEIKIIKSKLNKEIKK